MELAEFERIAEEVYDTLPGGFKAKIENLRIVIEELPGVEQMGAVGVRSPFSLLGLYQGIPLKYRTTGYGTYPIVPDTITLFKRNIELAVDQESKIRAKIREVLIHEIAHYFGMTEEEIRQAGY